MKFIRFRYLAAFALIPAFFSCKQQANKPVSVHPAFQDSVVNSLTVKIGKDPNNAGLYFQRGQALRRLAFDSMALVDYKRAATLDSSRAEYFSAVGDLLFDHKDVSGSVPWIERAVQLNPGDPQARMKIAKLFVFIKEYPKAFSEINTVLRQNAMNPEGYFLKGIIYKDLKDTAKAISSFQTTLQVDPDYKDAMIQLGTIYASRKDPLALKYYDNAFRIDTADVFPLYARGMFYQEQERFEEAKEEYRRAIVHDRDYDNAYFGMGYILMQQDSLDKAYRQFDLVTQLNPTDAKAYYNRGLCSELMGRTEQAREDYKQALVFEPEYPEAKEGLRRLGK